MGKVVAIDGPAGSGKGTVAKIIKEKCNLVYIDTGAMYRAVAYMLIKNNIDIKDEEKIVEFARNCKIYFNNDRVIINDLDVTDNIRTMQVNKIVSPVSSIVKLREILVDMQRDLAKDYDVIMEGRDITTVVFPNADFKIYLDATLDERAKRRFKELQAKNENISLEEVKENIASRDYNDMNKEVGALKRASDAIYLDTTNLSIDEVVDKIIEIIGG